MPDPVNIYIYIYIYIYDIFFCESNLRKVNILEYIRPKMNFFVRF